MSKHLLRLLAVLALGISFTACEDDDDSYAELRKHERRAISSFVKYGCNVVDESTDEVLLHVDPIKPITQNQFAAQDSTTDVSKNEYVYFPQTGLYMQIVRKGSGERLKHGENAAVICRYTEFNISGDSIQSTNRLLLYAALPDVMQVANNYGTFTGTFTSGVMLNYYGAAIPAAWLTPLSYINLGRLGKATDETALVRIIAPSSIGHKGQSNNVYPCFYEISYQRGR